MEVQQVPINPQDQHNRQPATASLPRRQDQAAKLKAATEALRLERNVPAPGPQVPSKSEDQPPPEKKDEPAKDPTAELLAKYEKARNDAQDRENRAVAATREQERISADATAKLAKLAEAKDDPVGFLSALGLNEDEWKEMLANGGKPTPAMKALSAMQARIEESDKRQQALEAQLTRAREATEIETFLPRFPLLKKLGGAEVARNHMANLRASGDSSTSYLDAMTQLEANFNEGLQAVLRDDEINAKYSYKSKAASPPVGSTTLGTGHTSSSASGEDKNPYPIGSRQHFEFKRNLAIQRLGKLAR